MPKKRTDAGPKVGARMLAALAGVVLLASGAIGVWQSLAADAPGASPIGALAVLLPASILLRYAATGKIVKP